MQDFEEFARECLAHHNRIRQMHGVLPLTYCRDLQNSAQDWASVCIQTDILKNSPTSAKGLAGESISMRKSSSGSVDMTGADVVEQWYKDVDNYDFQEGTGSAGNFTQMVWASTKTVGFGKAVLDGKCIVVAHYRPPGNVKGFYRDNVFSATGERSEWVDVHGLQENMDALRKTKIRTLKECYQDEYGRKYVVKKDIIQFVDENGNITEKIKETRIEGEDGNGKTTGQDETDEEFNRRIQTLPKQEKDAEIFMRDFRISMLNVHNAYRLRHGSPLLALNKELTSQAQSWAEELLPKAHLQNSHHLYHGCSLGENIASRWVSGGDCNYSAQDVVDHWHNESRSYDYSKEHTDIQGIGNFTQLVWKGSREFGVGRACGKFENGNKVIIVAMYYPPGNVLGGFRANVLPPCKEIREV